MQIILTSYCTSDDYFFNHCSFPLLQSGQADKFGLDDKFAALSFASKASACGTEALGFLTTQTKYGLNVVGWLLDFMSPLTYQNLVKNGKNSRECHI